MGILGKIVVREICYKIFSLKGYRGREVYRFLFGIFVNGCGGIEFCWLEGKRCFRRRGLVGGFIFRGLLF